MSIAIDAHQHVWDLSRSPYDWLDRGSDVLGRSIAFDEARADLDCASIAGSILVQADDTAGDTQAMLDVARGEPRVLGVVGWVPLEQPDVAAEHLRTLRRDSTFVGVRTLLHNQPDADYLTRADVDAGLSVLTDLDVPFDFVTAGAEGLRRLPAVLERHPSLRVVVDHLGSPPVGGGDLERGRWRSLLAAVAAHPRTYTKLSGLYAPRTKLRPFVADALAMFGPRRLIYGGDWPISLLQGGYKRVWRELSALVDELAPTARADILGDNAARFYRLDPTKVAALTPSPAPEQRNTRD